MLTRDTFSGGAKVQRRGKMPQKSKREDSLQEAEKTLGGEKCKVRKKRRRPELGEKNQGARSSANLAWWLKVAVSGKEEVREAEVQSIRLPCQPLTMG